MSDLIDLPTSTAKSPTAFKTISEVSQETGVPQHVLRFWEAKFSQLRPLKRGGGRRYYRPEDVALLMRIRRLLHEEGYTIKGVQKVLREQRGQSDDVAAPKMPRPAPGAFPRTRMAMTAQGSEDFPRRLVLDVESLGTKSGRDRLLQDVLEDLRDLRITLED
jgi:DNA-binding transcriptional MerR regulator